MIRETIHGSHGRNYPRPETYSDLGATTRLVSSLAQLLDIIGRATTHQAGAGSLRHEMDRHDISVEERQAHVLSSTETIIDSLSVASELFIKANRHSMDAHNELSHLADIVQSPRSRTTCLSRAKKIGRDLARLPFGAGIGASEFYIASEHLRRDPVREGLTF